MPQNTKGLLLRSDQQERVEFSTGVTFRNLDNFTWEGWVKPHPSSTSTNQRAWCEYQPNGQIRFAVTPIKGMLRFEYARKDGTTDTNYTYNYEWDDYWHHIAFTVDNGDETYQIYLDGAMVQSGTLVGAGLDEDDQPLPVSDTAPSAVVVGGRSGKPHWSGKMDVVRMWKSVVSRNEIQDHMYEIRDLAETANCMAQWRFEPSGSSTISADKHTDTVGTWTGTLKRGAASVTDLWTNDRPFLGDGEEDTEAPSTFTANAPTDVLPTSISWSWGEATDNVYVQYYEVSIAEDANFMNTVGQYENLNVGRNQFITFEGLYPQTNYYMRARAVDANGNASEFVTYNNNQVTTTPPVGDIYPPEVPVIQNISNVGTNSFRVNIGTPNDDTTGFKIDVSKTADFSSIEPAYRNRDIGLVSTYFININLLPSTTYYVRLRGYDASENESADSNVIMVTTEALPDLEPPSPVLPTTATAIEHNRFTARWNVGVDNIAVTGYRLDVSKQSDFSSFVGGYENKDVGDVLVANVFPLEPETVYYYRVRAYDAAGNVSANTDYAEEVITRATTYLEDAFYEATTEATDSVSRGGPTEVYQKFNTIYVGDRLHRTFQHVAENAIRYKLYVPLFEAQTGLAHSIMGAADDGEYQGDIVFGVTGPLGATPDNRAVQLNGPSGFVRFSNVLIERNSGVGMSFKLTDPQANTDNEILSLVNPDGQRNIIFSYRNGDLLVYSTDSTGTTKTTTLASGMTLNAWHQIGFSNTAAGLVLYYDGTTVTTVTGSFENAFMVQDIFIGHRLFGEKTYTVSAAHFFMTTEGNYAENTTYRSRIISSTVHTTDVKGFLRFQSTGFDGQPVNGSLRLFSLTDATSNLTVRGASSTTWTESTLTQANEPSQIGTPLSLDPLGEGPIDIDVTSLIDMEELVHGFVLTADVATNEHGVWLYGKSTGNARPSMIFEVDGSAATELRDVMLHTNEQTFRNLFPNPSFEQNYDGVTAHNGGTVYVTTADAYKGNASAAYIGSGANTGVRLVTGNIGGNTVRTFRGSVWLKAVDDLEDLNTCSFYAYYNDGTSTTVNGRAYITPNNWVQLRFPPLTTTTKTLNYIGMYLRGAENTGRSFFLDSVLITETDEIVPYFDGDVEGAMWEGEPHESPSVLTVYNLEGSVAYIGDSDDDMSVDIQYRHESSFGWITDLSEVTYDRVSKVASFFVPSYTADWNMAVNPSFEVDSDIDSGGNGTWEFSTEEARFGNRSLKATKNGEGVYFVNIPVVSATPEVDALTATFWIKSAPLSTPSVTALPMIVGSGTADDVELGELQQSGEWTQYRIDMEADTGGLDGINLYFFVNDAHIPLYIDGLHVYETGKVSNIFLDGDSPEGYWTGRAHHSTTARVIRSDNAYNVQAIAEDNDGVLGQNPISSRIVTPVAPDNVLTVTDIQLTPAPSHIDVEVTYTGDENETASLTLEWKRSDLTTWDILPHAWDRSTKKIKATLAGLRQGTEYDVRPTFSDPENPVYGLNGAVRSTYTDIEHQAPLLPTKITFGGYPLMSEDMRDIWVESHDGFSFPERNFTTEAIPRADGSVALSDYWGERTITMTGGFSGTTKQELAEKLSAFRRAMARKQQRLLIDTLDSREYFFTATCTRLHIEEVGGETHTHLQWTAEFTCPDPFRYQSNETTEKDIVLEDGDSIVITNLGDVSAYPMYTITSEGVLTAPKVTLINRTTGDRLSPTVGLGMFDRIDIDTKLLRVLYNGVEVDYAGSFPQLSVGPNQIEVRLSPPTGVFGTTSRIALTVRRRHRFF